MIIDEQDLNNVQIIGDRVLIKPKTHQDKTKSGLYLPPGVIEKEKVYMGYIIKSGPGFPVPAVSDYDEPWKTKEEVKYVPLQAQTGDLAVYLQNSTHEIVINNQKYVIVPHHAILMVFRDEGLLSE